MSRPQHRPSRHTHAAPRPFSDWIGTAVLDQDVTLGPRLEAVAGLDRQRWCVVAITVQVACTPGVADSVWVDAVDLGAIDNADGGFFEILKLAAAHGSVPVTRFHLDGATADDILTLMTGCRFQVQLAGLDAALNVVSHENVRHENVEHESVRPHATSRTATSLRRRNGTVHGGS
ncbi:hypothetical protein [Arthrobacter sp. SLBN-53]|uniref:hypothetical protein n=1 Tax=Arthrobacter sp. SLBN-53 TaxID=2768412 RepID=UPI00116AE1CC|nr:hypothetical protein [Arthrobacter sp. SLBN-53]TQK27911.1 hypothetical protein FBY28_0874 [Arthrobacter sp. SLBN-53]